MVFATSGFQSGALEYAKVYGVATVTFVEGSFLYETKGADQNSPPPAWANLPLYAGVLTEQKEKSISCKAFDTKDLSILNDWLQAE